jgi:hypothetical protein
MTTVEYDEQSDDFYAKCRDCGWESRMFALERNARQEANRHDELHDDGVIR